MADAVASQTVYDGPGDVVIKCTNISDGTGEAAVTKVDVSTLSPAPGEVTIKKIAYSTAGMGVDILWDATTDVLAWHIPPDVSGIIDFGDHPLLNNGGAGKTGDVQFTTVGHTAGDRYAITLYCRKRTA